MTDKEKLLRDINGLRESIALSWLDLARLKLTPQDRSAIREGIEALTTDLAKLG